MNTELINKMQSQPQPQQQQQPQQQVPHPHSQYPHYPPPQQPYGQQPNAQEAPQPPTPLRPRFFLYPPPAAPEYGFSYLMGTLLKHRQHQQRTVYSVPPGANAAAAHDFVEDPNFKVKPPLFKSKPSPPLSPQPKSTTPGSKKTKKTKKKATPVKKKPTTTSAKKRLYSADTKTKKKKAAPPPSSSTKPKKKNDGSKAAASAATKKTKKKTPTKATAKYDKKKASPKSKTAGSKASRTAAVTQKEQHSKLLSAGVSYIANSPIPSYGSSTTPYGSFATGKNKKSADEEDKNTLHQYQHEGWMKRYHELVLYLNEKGNSQVPHSYPENPELSRWCKRQRYQYKLYLEGKKESAMTKERVTLLQNINFVWDLHSSAWNEKFRELKEFAKRHGHCSVFPGLNPKLLTWAKAQRHQYRLLMDGQSSQMTMQRLKDLESIGFEWASSTPNGKEK